MSPNELPSAAPSPAPALQHHDPPLTPAQRALLDFCKGREASGLYHHLSDTLAMSVQNFCRNYPDEMDRTSPSESIIESWYFTLQVMNLLHDLAVERE